MEWNGISLEHDRRACLAEPLQDLLVDLVSLALNTNHARWHVVGPSVLPVRHELGLLLTEVRGWADGVAERAITLGVPIDGRPSTIGRFRVLKELPSGLIADRDVTVEIAHQMSDVVIRSRAALESLGAVDPVTQQLVSAILGSLEQRLWTLQAPGIARAGETSEAPIGELRQLRPAGA